MDLNRAVPVLSVPDVPRAVSVFRDVLGLEVVMDLGWVATLGSVEGPQISVMHEDATAACNPDLSLDVEDVDLAHERALDLGLEIVHPLTDEPWGVRRFFLRDSGGNVVNVLSHSDVSATAAQDHLRAAG
ncbi:VOC family protein [Oryzobacter telluris]|uniref:VOC family protein n=1 Tax=Oryzobacter telluris TaxID=3149179 RepID=UPI00370D4151